MNRGNSSSDRDVSDLRPPADRNDCQCECHKATHEAQQPHEATMIGRGK